MKLSNRLNLPQPIVDAVRNDDYTKGEAHMSVTGLLKPPRIVALERTHETEIEEDASDRIWSLVGQVVHSLLERADTTGTCEKRLSHQVGEWTISGQVDRYYGGIIQDYKFITVYKFKGGAVPEDFEQQLNCYAEIYRQNGFPVEGLEIVAIFRDWSKLEAKRDPNYPQTQVKIFKVQLWPEAKIQAFLKGRVKLHQDAMTHLPVCSESERWARPTVYAVMKEGRKTAVKLHDTFQFAQNQANSEPGLTVVKRPGISVRCSSYCSVSSFCSQYQDILRKEAPFDQAQSG